MTRKKQKVGRRDKKLLQIKIYGPYLDPVLNKSTVKKNTTVKWYF